MKKYSLLTLPVVLGALIGSVAIATLSVLVITLGSMDLAGALAFKYYERLNLAALSVILPVAGMIALLPLALYQAFKQEVVEAAVPAKEVSAKASPVAAAVEPQHLKAA